MCFVFYTLVAMLSVFVTMVLVAYIRTKTRYENLWMWSRNEEMYFPPILIGIAYVIPKYQFKKMSRESVVERIRKE